MKQQLRRCLAAFLLIGIAHCAGAVDGKIRVLIVDGFSDHDWQQTTALIRGILAPSGLFEIAVSTAPEKAGDPAWASWHPKFSDYDVVIQTCNDINHGPAWPEPVKHDFEDFVRGGGVYIFHSAQDLQVLAYARDSKPDQRLLWPVEWTVSYGKGRVYISTYGHMWRGDVQPAGLRCAAVQTIIPRAVQWLAKRPVTLAVPPDFPGTNAVYIRPEFNLIPQPGR